MAGTSMPPSAPQPDASGKDLAKAADAKKPVETKAELVLKRLRTAKGATIAALSEATGWQAHSVRGFLSGVVRKKLGLTLVSEISKDGMRRYRIVADQPKV